MLCVLFLFLFFFYVPHETGMSKRMWDYRIDHYDDDGEDDDAKAKYTHTLRTNRIQRSRKRMHDIREHWLEQSNLSPFGDFK